MTKFGGEGRESRERVERVNVDVNLDFNVDFDFDFNVDFDSLTR